MPEPSNLEPVQMPHIPMKKDGLSELLHEMTHQYREINAGREKPLAGWARVIYWIIAAPIMAFMIFWTYSVLMSGN